MTGMHEAQQPGDGGMAASISNAVVRLLSEYTGRGPTMARTLVGEELITVVLRDTLTKGERSLVSRGEEALVLGMRKAYQRTMRDDLVAAVEEISGRTVAAFLSDNHVDPDVAIETFILAPRAGGEEAGSQR